MMTDKATVEMESPVAGTVVELAGEVGDQVPIGSALVVIETEGEVAAEEPAVASRRSKRRRSAEIGPSSIEAENPGAGRGRCRDARLPRRGRRPAGGRSAMTGAHRRRAARPDRPAPPRGGAERRPAQSSPPPPSARARRTSASISPQVKAAEATASATPISTRSCATARARAITPRTPADARADEAIKVIGMRRRIAENMAASKRAIPHFTYVDEIDVTALEDDARRPQRQSRRRGPS